MLERAVESGVPFGWVAGDEVYGNDRNLRLWLEHQGIPHVLATRSHELWPFPLLRMATAGPLHIYSV